MTINDETSHSLDLGAFRGYYVFPVHEHTGIAEDTRHVHVRVLDANALMWSAPKYEVVPRVTTGQAFRVQPPFGKELGWLREDFWVLQRRIKRWNNHATRWNRVRG